MVALCPSRLLNYLCLFLSSMHLNFLKYNLNLVPHTPLRAYCFLFQQIELNFEKKLVYRFIKLETENTVQSS